MIVTMTMLIKVAFVVDNLLYNVYSHTFIKFIAVLGSLNLDSKGSCNKIKLLQYCAYILCIHCSTRTPNNWHLYFLVQLLSYSTESCKAAAMRKEIGCY